MQWFALTIILIFIDQLTKWIAVRLGWSIFLNEKFAFSLPVPVLIMFIIYFVVLGGIAIYLFRTWNRFSNLQKAAWSLVLAGGLSNIVERLVLGHVRDFIFIANGILNIADLYILLGLTFLLVSQRFSRKEKELPSEKLI